SAESKVEPSRAHQDTEVAVLLRSGSEPVLRDEPMPLLQCHAELHPSDVRTQASMRSRSEREMAVRGPREVDLVGPLELVGVATGGRREGHHEFALLDVLPSQLG